MTARGPGNARARRAGRRRGSAPRPAHSPPAAARAAAASASCAAATSSRTAKARRRRCPGSRAAARATTPASRATTMPPSTSLCPPRYLVVLCITRSAPSASGCCSTGLAKVLSQPSRAPRACASAASAARSLTRSNGFDGVSTHSSVAPGSSALPRRVEVGGVDELGAAAPARQDLAQLPGGAVVAVRRAHHATARRCEREDGERRGRARRERDGLVPALERRDGLLERAAIRVAAARVGVAVRVAAVGAALEGRREVDRLAQRAGGGIGLAARVHGQGLQLHGGRSYSWMATTSRPGPPWTPNAVPQGSSRR